MKNNICPLVQDLLPNYTENLCSEESTALVKDHLSQCTDCMAKLAGIEEVLPAESAPPNPSAPLKKIKRHYIKRALAVVVIIALLALPGVWVINSLRGEGMSFASFTANNQTQKVLRALEAGDYHTAAGYMAFDEQAGPSTNGVGPKNEVEFINNMISLEKRGIKVIGGNSNLFNYGYNSGHMMGKAGFEVEMNGERYMITLPVLYTGNKIAFYRTLLVFGPLDDGGNWPQIKWDKYPLWISDFEKGLSNFSTSLLH